MSQRENKPENQPVPTTLWGTIPRGMEVLIKKAAVDTEFRRQLLADREKAVAGLGLKLDATEALLLKAVPSEQLDRIIAQTKVPEAHRAAFLGTAAALMLAIVGVSGPTKAAEGPVAPGGVRPDIARLADAESLKTAMREHEDMRKQKDSGYLALTTWFRAEKAMHSAVSAQGKRELIKSGAAFPMPAIDADNLATLTAALPKLPASNAPKDLSDTVVVSWKEGAEWKTRTYSRANVPADAARVLVLLGLPENRPEEILPTKGVRPNKE
ncbi:MAG TPA: Os1348 family NHLP clan protein [Planctomycetota bacterium]|jgi:hypothetical protein